VYDPTLTTNRGSANVLLVDPFNSLIQVDALPAGTSANDVIVHDGLTGAQPVSLFGVLYHQSNATTGTWLNLNRATYPVELATPRVNGNNSAITPGAVRLAINKVRKSLGSNQVSKLIAYTSLEQEHQWEQLGVTISQIIKEGAGGRASDLDLLFTGEKSMAGVPIKSSINANQSRIDFLDLSHWGTRRHAGHRFLRCRRANRVPDLRRQRRPRVGVHLLLRDGLPGLERVAKKRRVHRQPGHSHGVLILATKQKGRSPLRPPRKTKRVLDTPEKHRKYATLFTKGPDKIGTRFTTSPLRPYTKAKVRQRHANQSSRY
jgi:hypothetical protein